MMAFLIDMQRSIYAALTSDITAYSNSRDIAALVAMLPLGIVFGAAHALTPGHSKSVLAAYVLGSGLKPSRALLTSFVLSVTHITSAVLLALITNSLVTRSLVGAGRAPSIEWTSRLILVAIGLWLIFRAIRARPHVHGEGIATGFIAGLIPCPLTLFVMTLALSRAAPEAGLAFSISMLMGVATILGTVAVVSAIARSSLAHVFEHHGTAIARVSRVMDALAGVALTSIALFELSR
jgi:ABC-type nickel/cobalt efflux system permease component RcnA